MIQEGTEYLSPTFKHMFGYEDSELPNNPESWQTLIFPEDLPGVFEVFNKHVASRGASPYYNEVRYRHKNGSTVWVICTGKVIEWDAQGQAVRMVGCHVDITARKQAEAALQQAYGELEQRVAERTAELQESEERFSTFMSHLPASAFINDATGRLLFANKHLEELLNLQNWEGKTPPELVPGEAGQQMLKDDRRALSQGSIRIQETMTVANGEQRTFETIKFQIQVEGKPTLLGGIGFDITERKQAEEALQRNRAMLARTESIAGVGSWEWDTAMDKVTWSDEMFRIFQLNPAEGAPSFAEHPKFYHPKDMQQLRIAVEAAVSHGTPYELELSIIRKDGERRVCLSRGLAEMGSGTTASRLFGSFQDITEHKRAEAEREKLEAQNRQLQKSQSLGRMAGAVAHHFNNQLQAVMLNLEMASDNLDGNASIADTLAEALRSAHKAANVTSLMLTYLGQTVARQEPIDLSAVCQLQLPLLQASIPRSVVWETDLPTPGPAICANIDQIQQVLNNLITNAWEALSGTQGSIRLSSKTVSAADIPTSHRFPIDAIPQANDHACLEVADTGCGIAAQDIENIFDPFFSHKFIGRGMGLSIVLGIVRAHRGVVTVESQPGRGSVFRVFLPVSATAVPQTPLPVVHTLKPAGGITVLLVEDETEVRKVAAAGLKRLGYAVIAAQDGVEALELFRQRREEIRCVLCDLTMPRMDGWETLTALRQIAPGIPVILASGYSKAQVMAGDHPEQPQVFLRKPYSFRLLGDAIARALTEPKASD